MEILKLCLIECFYDLLQFWYDQIMPKFEKFC